MRESRVVGYFCERYRKKEKPSKSKSQQYVVPINGVIANQSIIPMLASCPLADCFNPLTIIEGDGDNRVMQQFQVVESKMVAL